MGFLYKINTIKNEINKKLYIYVSKTLIQEITSFNLLM